MPAFGRLIPCFTGFFIVLSPTGPGVVMAIQHTQLASPTRLAWPQLIILSHGVTRILGLGNESAFYPQGGRLYPHHDHGRLCTATPLHFLLFFLSPRWVSSMFTRNGAELSFLNQVRSASDTPRLPMCHGHVWVVWSKVELYWRGLPF
ncbi:hypothetical protein BDP81DRAFT_65962 [Colletotrichum phormii]|uniref:Secreted protein n=1 Tax=Colletotrichum phormii TaxID=359342 RepID=A0AAI9ZNZ0_9PEZI|nr:uncharacterized protein BDP81DRAFT_65962 [Colletotrichum phormii]KAK1634124.1 hypothetical protein BDP81DRAFT_65962 [Colletotrichum phormii]